VIQAAADRLYSTEGHSGKAQYLKYMAGQQQRKKTEDEEAGTDTQSVKRQKKGGRQKAKKKEEEEEEEEYQLTREDVGNWLKSLLQGVTYSAKGVKSTQNKKPELTEVLLSSSNGGPSLNTLAEKCATKLASPHFASQLNTNVHMMPLSDGITIVLSKTEPPTVRPSRASDYFSLVANVGYEDVKVYLNSHWVDGKKPPLRRFLERALGRLSKGGGPEYAEYVRKWNAMILYGDCNFLGRPGHRLVLKEGPGGNGKSWESDLFLKALGDFGGKTKRSLWLSGDGGTGHQQEDVAARHCKRYVTTQEMPSSFLLKADLEFMKDFSAGGQQQAMKKFQSLKEVLNHAQGPQIACNEIGETLHYQDAMERRLELHRYETYFESSAEKLKQKRCEGTRICYQADTPNHDRLAPVLMAILLDTWEEMVKDQCWPTQRPKIMQVWLEESGKTTHAAFVGWWNQHFAKQEEVQFEACMYGKPVPANIDVEGRRLFQWQPDRYVTYSEIKELLAKPESKTVHDQYLTATGSTLDNRKLTAALNQATGRKLDAKGPEYFRDGDKSTQKIRCNVHCYRKWQSKTQAIAEAKYAGCMASFNTGMPPTDPGGDKTEPLTKEMYKQLTTSTDLRSHEQHAAA
jgi:hypothetical protein